MSGQILLFAALLLASIPALLSLRNQFEFRSPPPASARHPRVSILIPARNEAANIGTAVASALASVEAEIEVIVMDDHSQDATAAIVSAIAQRDDRLRVVSAPPLPDGWCGKMHACKKLAELARYDVLLFVDADIAMAPKAVARLAAFLETSGSDLVSAFPRQITGSLLEKLLIPMIEFMVLGFLPLAVARQNTLPSMAAGCGQVLMAKTESHRRIGGHSAIRLSLHDGIKLTRAYREAGLRTDVCSGIEIFEGRMYSSAREVWAGLAKNSHEGAAAPPVIGIFTVLLFGGGVLPLLLVLSGGVSALNWLALALSYLPRIVNAVRFRQSWLGVALHPLALVLFLTIQWQSFFRQRLGVRPQWKGRSVG